MGVVLGATSFYAESGGQVADSGVITAAAASFDVTDVQVGEGEFRACFFFCMLVWEGKLSRLTFAFLLYESLSRMGAWL